MDAADHPSRYCRRRHQRVASVILFVPAAWLLFSGDKSILLATLGGGASNVLYKMSSIHSTRHLGQTLVPVLVPAFGVSSTASNILHVQGRRLLTVNYDGPFDYESVSRNGTCSDGSNTTLDASETYAGTTSTSQCAEVCDSSGIGCAAFHFDEDISQCLLSDEIPSNAAAANNDPGICHTKRAPAFVSIPNSTFGYW